MRNDAVENDILKTDLANVLNNIAAIEKLSRDDIVKKTDLRKDYVVDFLNLQNTFKLTVEKVLKIFLCLKYDVEIRITKTKAKPRITTSLVRE